mgnify:CR=1 FL=1
MVEKDYEVALLMGDNHNDFHSAFRNKSVAEQLAETDRFKDSWGKIHRPAQPNLR